MNLSEMLRFLEKKLDTEINIEVKNPIFYQSGTFRLTPDQYLHHSPFCRKNKLADGNRICSVSKMECLRKCTSPEPFFRTCPFGMKELVSPIILNDQLYAVLFFGANKDEQTCCRYSTFLTEWILLELESAVRMAKFPPKQRTPEFYTESCLNFIETHYMENIHLTDLTDFLRVNPNYIGGLLKSRLGKNFHALLTERRLREAKIYLRLHKHLTISEISNICGFSDSNYFCLVFHRHCGMAPRDYRRLPLEADI